MSTRFVANDVEMIILDHDGGDVLLGCLRSVASQTLPPSRVIVVDNGSHVPVRERVGDPAILVIRHDENRGFTGGINEAMTRIAAPLIAWVNNDVTLDPAWLETVRREIESDARIAAVQSVVARADGRVDGAGITIDGGRYRQRGHGSTIDDALQDGELWGVSATAALYRVDALRAVSEGDDILDPRFFAWYEDVELCARLRRAGWAMRVVPRVLATHLGSATSAALGPIAERLRITNRYRVARLHPGVGSRGALLREDARRCVRMVVRGELGRAARTAWYAVAGSFGPLD